MSAATLLTELLDLARIGPVTAELLDGVLAPRTTMRATADVNQKSPPWVRAVRGHEVFLTMDGDILGVALWNDARGWGTYAEMAVARGTLAEVVAVVGPTEAVPRNPDDFHSGEKRSAYVERGGKTVRVLVELSATDPSAVRRLTLHFKK